MDKIFVAGSSNTDMVIKSKKFPKPGETILGGRFLMNPGGKGANQAVAAARLGGMVTFVGKIGNDIFGKQAVRLMEDEGINVGNVVTDQEMPSGVAMITVDEKGEKVTVAGKGRHDPCVVPRAVPIVEAMAALVIADFVLMNQSTKLGSL